MEVAVAVFSPLLDVLADVPDPRRAEGKLYKLPHVLLFSILAIVAGCNSYRGIVTFVDVHRRKLNAAFGLIPNAICSDSNVSRVGSTGCGSVCFHDDGG